jgi:N6-L-threonylcarbamoyladenine synthase
MSQFSNKNREIYFLAVETSCDDTSISVLRAKESKDKLKKIEALSNVVSSQTQLHAGYGGVYPFLAKREHQKNLPLVFEKAIKKFAVSKIKFIGVTKGPGLDPCLWTGINFAQNLAKKCNLPLVGANHLEAHFLANLLTLGIGEEKFKKDYLPAVCLVVSGGHTLLFLATAIGEYKLLGETQDDAAGECFDKAARILGLGYPGGPEIAKCAEKFAKSGNKESGIKLPRPMLNRKNFNFSFSGLKTAVLYLHQKQTLETQKSKIYSQGMSYEIQQSIIDVLVSKTMRAAIEFNVKSIIIGGGVSANHALRDEFRKKIKESKNKFKFLAPSRDLSCDNAAMAGVAAYFAWKRGEMAKNPEDLVSDPNLGI